MLLQAALPCALLLDHETRVRMTLRGGTNVRTNVEEGVWWTHPGVSCAVSLRRCVAAVLRCCVPRSALCTLHLLEERVHATMLTRTHTYTHSTASHLFISGTGVASGRSLNPCPAAAAAAVWGAERKHRCVYSSPRLLPRGRGGGGRYCATVVAGGGRGRGGGWEGGWGGQEERWRRWWR